MEKNKGIANVAKKILGFFYKAKVGVFFNTNGKGAKKKEVPSREQIKEFIEVYAEELRDKLNQNGVNPVLADSDSLSKVSDSTVGKLYDWLYYSANSGVSINSWNGPDHNVKEGDLGGWIQSEKNLVGDAWVKDDAKVYDNARVHQNAILYENAEAYGNAAIHGKAQIWGHCNIYGYAQVFQEAQVYGMAQVFGEAQVRGRAVVHGLSKVFGSTMVYEYANVYGRANVYEYANVSGNSVICGDAAICGGAAVYGSPYIAGNAIIKAIKDYLVMGPLGIGRYITFTKSNNKVAAGCFLGTIDEFEASVNLKYNGNSDYYPIITCLRTMSKSTNG